MLGSGAQPSFKRAKELFASLPKASLTPNTISRLDGSPTLLTGAGDLVL